VSSDTADTLDVTGLDADAIGLLARDHHLAVLELTPRRPRWSRRTWN